MNSKAPARGRGSLPDWIGLTDEWRAAYVPDLQKVRSGEMPWTKLDDLRRMELEILLNRFGAEGLSEAQKVHTNRVWHRLEPWPDTAPTTHRLRGRYILSPLWNSNVSLLTNLARHAGLPFDLVLSAELCRPYKSDPETYRMAYELLDLEPHQAMMAAHSDNLLTAVQEGLRTGFFAWPGEYGPHQHKDLHAQHDFDIIANDLCDLADQLLSQPIRSE